MEDDGIEIWRPSPEEWERFKETQLNLLGITYEELTQQARNSQFQSAHARHLWVIIGD